MDRALDTLFHALQHVDPQQAGRLGFLNARYHPFLDTLHKETLFLQQSFRPDAAALEGHDFTVSRDSGDAVSSFDCMLALLPKNADEARYIMALALERLVPGGRLICAAENDAGGARLVKLMKSFGMDAEGLSKNHARAAWAKRENLDESAFRAALAEGAMQKVEATGFVSCPGLFSWGEIDKGSRLLIDTLSEELNGEGADFGCGYGVIARHILLQQWGDVKKLHCVDADSRALQACTFNLQDFGNVDYHWLDLTREGLADLDWIVMNPPFHRGKTAEAAIGQGFIENAARSLKDGGVLWMVANARLPYEKVLKDNFSKVEQRAKGGGYKVCKAVR